MLQATVRHEEWQGRPIIVLENEDLAAYLCSGLGNNLYRLYDKRANREILKAPSSPQELDEIRGAYGTPLMMPPNRIREGRFTFEGRDYQFGINNAQDHHIHGFLRDYPWTVEETGGEDSGKPFVICSYRTSDFPKVIAQYPHELEVRVTFRLEGSSLVQDVAILNLGNDKAPVGFGLHTWFMLDGEPDAWTLTVPAEEQWELDADNIPTGRRVPLGPYAAMPTGMNLAGADMDHVFQVGENPVVATLTHRNGYTVRYSASDTYKQWVIFTKGVADQWICLEPYTWVTNAPNIDEPRSVTGLRAVTRNEPLSISVTLEIQHQS